MRAVWSLLSLSACGGAGTWKVETWGEDYIEQQIPGDVFADGCSVVYDEFLVTTTTRELLDGDGAVAGELPGSEVYDLTVPGPSPMGQAEVPADHYSRLRVVVAPDPDAAPGTATADQVAALALAGASVLVAGTLTCGADAATFRWAFDASTTYDCAPPDLTVPAGGSDDTQLTIHGDHLFYDGLENPDAAVRGQAILDADADLDGEVTATELTAVSIPALGYEVGQYGDVLTLGAFVEHLSRTIVHVDGEGECTVDFE
jgi:hypothetical protein